MRICSVSGDGAWGAAGIAAAAAMALPSHGNREMADVPVVVIRRALDDIGLADDATGDDHAFFLELAGDADDFLLRLLDIAQAHGAEDVHLLAQHLGGALRHVAEEALADFLAGALERGRQ